MFIKPKRNSNALLGSYIAKAKTLHLPTLALLLTVAPTVHAQYFKDPSLETLLSNRNYVELEKVANARLSNKPDDHQAVLALAVIALRGANRPEDVLKRKTSIAQSEACLVRQPDAGVCHYTLGSVLGIQAMSEGMLKMAGSVGKIKDSLAQAVALESQWYPARSALVSFYLMAPGIAGGSKSKAREVAKAAPKQEQTRALEAAILLNEDQDEAALQMLSAIKPSEDRYFNDEITNLSFGAALGLLNAGKTQASRPTFEKMIRERPLEPNGWWGMARVNAETGNHAEAVKLFSNLASLKGAESLPVNYRLGISLQALGQIDLAKAALTSYVNAGKGTKKSIEDAKARLELLKG
jgi:tetratricopeptide (TPR) repeat protein